MQKFFAMGVSIVSWALAAGLVGVAAARLLQAPSEPLAWAWGGAAIFVAALSRFSPANAHFARVSAFSAACTLIAVSIWNAAGHPIEPVVAGLAGVLAIGCWLVLTPAAPTRPGLDAQYLSAVGERTIRRSTAQLEVARSLDAILAEHLRRERWHRWPWRFLRRVPRGVYLYGDVGRGKSFLLDAMYANTPSRQKRRFHFYQLLTSAFDGLNSATAPGRGARSMRRMARELAAPGSLVVVDDVNVLDIATAQVFIRLLTAWWRDRCVVCLSSNQAPEELLAGVAIDNELSSEFIARLRDACQPLELAGDEDYRQQKLSADDFYQHPFDAATEVRLRQIVDLLAESELATTPIDFAGRSTPSRGHARGVAWFDFDVLCGGACGYRDYLLLIDAFPNIVLSGIPQINDEDHARRFAWLVEVAYDRRRRLVLAAEVPLDDLFADGLSSRGLDVDFDKVRSRLIEMQSSEYDYELAQANASSS